MGRWRSSPYLWLFLVSFSLWWLGAELRGGRSLFEHDVIDQHTLQAMAWLEGRLDLGRSPKYLEIAEYEGRYYDSFPPTPAVLELLLVPVFGRNTPNSVVLFVLVFAAQAALFRMFRLRGFAVAGAFAAAAAFVFGTNVYVSCVKATVWAQGQAYGFAFAVLGLSRVLDNAGRGLAGPALGYGLLSLAVGCRPFYLFMVPLFVALDWRTSGRRLPQVLGTAALAMAPYGALLAAHNWARFGDPLEFGHSYLPWARALPDGLFSFAYLPRNAGLAFLRLPDLTGEPPYLVFDPNGTAFWLNNGILLVALFGLLARFDGWVRAAAALSLAAIGLGVLLYASTGWRQFGFRFFIDLLPAAAVVFLHAYRRWTPAMTVALACSLAANLYGLALTKTMTRHAAVWRYLPDREPEPSLAAQRDDRIDRRGAPRRHVCGEQRCADPSRSSAG